MSGFVISYKFTTGLVIKSIINYKNIQKHHSFIRKEDKPIHPTESKPVRNFTSPPRPYSSPVPSVVEGPLGLR